MKTVSDKLTKEDMEYIIIRHMDDVWQYVGGDTLQLIAEYEHRDYAKREEVIEVVLDAGRTEETLKGEVLKYYQKLSFKQLEKLALKAFPLKRYGM